MPFWKWLTKWHGKFNHQSKIIKPLVRFFRHDKREKNVHLTKNEINSNETPQGIWISQCSSWQLLFFFEGKIMSENRCEISTYSAVNWDNIETKRIKIQGAHRGQCVDVRLTKAQNWIICKHRGKSTPRFSVDSNGKHLKCSISIKDIPIDLSHPHSSRIGAGTSNTQHRNSQSHSYSRQYARFATSLRR